MINKTSLSERDICTKFITPAVKQAGWDEMTQIREEVSFTKGRIIVRGKMVSRGQAKRADYVLYFKPNIPLAIIEAKDMPASALRANRWRSSSTRCTLRDVKRSSQRSDPARAPLVVTN